MTSVTGREPAGLRLTAYYWRRGFLLLGPSFVLDRSAHPYRRLSATLMIARRNPFLIEAGDGPAIRTHAVLIAPNVLRKRICAIDSDLMICDLAMVTPEFVALAPLLEGAAMRELDATQLESLTADFDRAYRGELDAAALRELLHRVILCLSGQRPASPQLDHRIQRVLEFIETRPMNEVTLPWLAAQVHISCSRLRHLFREQVGSNLTHYLRWAAVWKGVWLWSNRQPFAAVAEAVGFHDLAHLNHAFNEVFGLNPSAVTDPGQLRLIRCDWD